VAAGTPPDIVDFHPNYFYGMARDGILLDLSELLGNDPAFDLNDFYKPVLDALTVKGKLYGIPQRISYYHLYYNADFFGAAGLHPPAADWLDRSWNWEAYLQAARKLSIDQDGDGVIDRAGGTFGQVIGHLVYWFAQGGTGLFDPDYTRLNLGSSQGIETLRYLADGFSHGAFRWGPWNDFASGKTAMLNETPAVIQLLRDAKMAYGWEVAALPQGPAGPATSLQPVPYALIATSPHKEEAAEFFKFMFSKEMSQRQSAAGIIIQPRRSVVTSPAFRQGLGVANAKAVLDALNYATPIPNHLQNFTTISNTIFSMVNKVCAGQMAPQQAMASIEDQIAALLAEGR